MGRHRCNSPPAGESVKFDPQVDAAEQIEQFLQSLSMETTDLGTIAPRLVQLVHALDHLAQLHDAIKQIPPTVRGWQPPAAFEAGALALAAWLDVMNDPEAVPNPAVFRAIEDASKQLRDERSTGREKLLEKCSDATHDCGDRSL